MDISNPKVQQELDQAMAVAMADKWYATPVIGKAVPQRNVQMIKDPSDHRRIVGECN